MAKMKKSRELGKCFIFLSFRVLFLVHDPNFFEYVLNAFDFP